MLTAGSQAVLPRRVAGILASNRMRAAGVASLLIKLGNLALGLLTAVLLARLLGADGYGQYAFVYAFVAILAVPTGLGLPKLLVRETAIAAREGRLVDMRAIWRWAHIVVILSTAVIAPLLIAYVTFISAGAATPTAFYVAVLLLPLVVLGNLRGAVLRGLDRVVLGQFPQFVLRPLLFACALGAAILFWPSIEWSPVDALWMHVAAALAAFVFGTFVLIRTAPEPPTAPKVESQLNKKALLVSAAALAGAAGLTVINNNIDLIMLGFLRSDTEVGIYRPVSAISEFVVIGFQIVAMIASHHIALLFRSGEKQKLQDLVSKATRAAFALALLLTIGLVLFGDRILATFFGAVFQDGYIPLIVLCCANLLSVACGPTATILNMAGHERLVFRALLVAVAVNIALNYLLIGAYGMTGAAFATGTSLLLVNVIFVVIIRRKVEIRPTILGQ